MSGIAFVDSRVHDYERLLAGLGAEFQVVILDPTQDGVKQIVAALEGLTDLDSIHIVSHGSSGALYLGSTVLTEDSLGGYETELTQIGASLSDAGDLLLYGCSVGAGDAGQSFIGQLARYTGADVAASTDATGATELGGDWVLETSTGAIEARAFAPADFAGLLAPPTVTAAGTLDATFSSDGKLTTPIGTSYDVISSLALQGDGRIVVAGRSDNGANDDFALARYNANGSLDTTFGSGGKITTQIGTGSDQIQGLALQADGRIVVAGDSVSGVNEYFALARYNANGGLDTTFGSSGKVTTAIGPGAGGAINCVVLQADGKIVAGGYAENGGSLDFALARYHANGTLDTTFGSAGKLTTAIGTSTDVITGLVLQADGRIVAAGYSMGTSGDFDFALARYNADGALDSTFDIDGKLITPLSASGDIVTSLAVQADGRIVAAGFSFNGANDDFALARYHTNGSLDTTFGSGGIRTDAIGSGSDAIAGITLQADGKIVAAGVSFNGTDDDFALARYNANGGLDTTFGSGGKLTTTVGTSNDVIISLALQTDGAIVAAGRSFNGANDDFALIRLVGGPGIPDVSATENFPFSFTFNANTFTDPEGGALTYAVGALPAWLTFNPATRTFSGTPASADVGSAPMVTVTATDSELFSVNDSFVINVQNNAAPTLYLDRGFDSDGKATTPIGTSLDQITSMVLQADGRIVAAGRSFSGANDDFALARYNANGSLDSTFDADGKRIDGIGAGADLISSLALQTDGKLVVAGRSFDTTYDFALARYNSNGTLDSTFGNGGKVTTPIGAGIDDIKSVAVQSDGNIVVAGYSSNGTDHDFALARYDRVGVLDPAFGNGGTLTTPIGTSSDAIVSMVLQTNGKIVVAGNSHNGVDFDFALARYTTNGTLDPTFNGTGQRIDTVGAGDEFINSMALQADGRIVVAGSSDNGTDDDFALARYNTDGTLDGTFSGDGKLTTAIGAGEDRITSVVLQADGRIVVAGSSFNGANNDFALARYNTDGTLDTTFDGDGKLVISVGAGDDAANGVKVQSDGAIVVAGYATGIDGTQDFAVIRLLVTPGIADQTMSHSTPLTYAITGFTDPEGGPLVYGATLADGSALPAWLGFGGANNFFSGTPNQTQVGRYDIKVTATDIWSASSFDVFALAVSNTNGTSGSDTLYGGLGADTMTGLAGDDVYIVDNAGDGVIEGAGAGTDLVRASATHTLGVEVENLTLTGNASIHGTGNALVNVILGNSAANTLNGADGNDSLVGGAGNDLLDWTGSLRGGIDTMRGGTGDDQFSLSAGDVIQEFSGEGTDTAWVDFAGTYTLISTVENLTLWGSTAGVNGRGNAGNNVIIGNAQANTLDGAGGNDSLVGGGGNDLFDWTSSLRAGIDTMRGGAGDDQFSLTSGDYVFENAAEGTDTVWVDFAGTYVLGANLENLTLWGATVGVNGTGNSAVNVILGNSQSNTLNGADGNDTMNGGAGNDLFDWTSSLRGGNDWMYGRQGDDQFVINAGDVVQEFYTEGTDTVWVDFAGTYILGPTLENLTLWGSATGVNGTGNAANNVMQGNSAANTLNGAGGNDSLVGGAGNDLFDWTSSLRTGTDTMVGGTGDDQFNLSSGDIVVESAGQGTDTAWADFGGYVLAANVENLTLWGASAINGTGNSANNTLTGNAAINSLDGGDGNDTINGAGGADTLIGGIGDDTLIHDAADAAAQGGTGTDTYRIATSGITLNLAGLAGVSRTGIEVIDLTGTGNNTLTANLTDVLAISDTTNTLRVEGNTGDMVNAGTGWTDGGSAGGYHTYTQGAATLIVDEDVTRNILT